MPTVQRNRKGVILADPAAIVPAEPVFEPECFASRNINIGARDVTPFLGWAGVRLQQKWAIVSRARNVAR